MKKMFTRKLITIVSVLLLALSTKAQMTTISVGGTSRSMFVYAPTGIQANRPLVISMHGLNQDINYQKGQAKWELVADTAKFVVVYPAGAGNSWDISGTKDTDFILAIIESMVTRYGIDRNRVYVSGFSMGGMMCYNVANKIANKVAAIGPVSGYLFGNTVASSRPMPIIHVHGTADDVVYYNASGNQQGVVAMLQKWRTWNGCPATGTRTTPYPTNKPNSKSVREYWGPCNNSEVELITLDGKGHWHSNDDAGVHTTRELWRFFKKQSLGPVVVLPTVSITSPANNSSYIEPASISLNATAAKTGGSISKVEFYNGTTKLGEDATSPYAYTWANVAKGTYTITAVATDNAGNKATSAAITIKVNVAQGPYNGAVHQIPGTIQVEEYDLGGNDVAYSDGSPGSAVTPVVNYRTDEDVDIETCTDAGGGYNLGFATAGEWLEYTVNVQVAGNYDLDIRGACSGDGRTISLAMDGTTFANNVAIPNTGGWQTWTTTSLKNIPLKAGKQIMRLTVGATDYVNLNYVDFKSVVTGLDEEAFTEYSLYPNPFHTEGLHIQKQGSFNYTISDISGAVLEKGKAENAMIVGKDLKQGIYFLSIEQNNISKTSKIVKQ